MRTQIEIASSLRSSQWQGEHGSLSSGFGIIPPPGVRLCFLPAYTPELQPAERLWPLTNKAIAKRGFATLDELDAALVERCRRLDEQSDLIKALTQYAWWPEVIDGN